MLRISEGTVQSNNAKQKYKSIGIGDLLLYSVLLRARGSCVDY